MTLNELSQLLYLENEIKLIRTQLISLQEQQQDFTVYDCVQASTKTEPFKKHTELISGIGCSPKSAALAMTIRERKARLADVLLKREQECLRLEQYINEITDSLTRQILTLRFIHGKSWLVVATRVGGDNTADSVRKIATRYVGGK